MSTMLYKTTLNIKINSRRCTIFSLPIFFYKMAEFCQLQKLLEWKLCILESWSTSSKLFITWFLTTFIPTKTMYRVIGNNCIRFKNHQICEFGKLWRLPEGEDFKIGSFSLRYKLFKIPFLTTFVSIKTFYDQIWNIFVDQIYLIFEFFRILLPVSSKPFR